ncbi:MAG TPA: HAMP domain-containing sensor histidine kinase [Acidimicrobiia bacterium]|nr:HAMP domain-containing sensor histidine kinase [Acidimicrobiia bacterium]
MNLSWQSIRFRLSVQYSALVFGLGGALLGLVYLAIQSGLSSQEMMTHLWEGRVVTLDGGAEVVLPHYSESEVQAIESIYNQIVLDEVARFTIMAIVILFLLSLIVGWVMSGRVLKPVGEITSVAREIQASDLSRRIALEGPDDELKRLADTFDEMLQRLDTAFASQRQLMADTSHDLRTPLTVIRSNIELVADDPAAGVAEWREAGDVIRRNAERMSEMIAGLLATARMQTGQAKSVQVDLAALVEGKVADFAPVAAQRDLTIVARSEPVAALGVEVALDRALANLIENALKVAPRGSVVNVGSGVSEGWAWIGVSDVGPGLPAEPGDRVGLGLSIVTQVAESHGGSLGTFPGSDGRGTTMVVWIPAESETTTPPPGFSPFTDI